jgi:hypothetical protein
VVLKCHKVDEYGMDGRTCRNMEELVIVHCRLDGKSVEECHFAGVCLSGRIDFDVVAQVQWRSCDYLRK